MFANMAPATEMVTKTGTDVERTARRRDMALAPLTAEICRRGCSFGWLARFGMVKLEPLNPVSANGLAAMVEEPGESR
jgi:hypothetical protein